MRCHLVELIVAIFALCSFALLLLATIPLVAVGTWAIVIVAHVRAGPTMYAANIMRPGSMSAIEVVPLALAFLVQYVLDRAVPSLGSAIMLFGQLAAISSVVNDSTFPTARIRR